MPPLLGPLGLCLPPADRHHRGTTRVEERGRHSVDETAVARRSEVDELLGSRNDGADHLHVEHDLAVGALPDTGPVADAVHRDRGELRHRLADLLEVAAQLGTPEASTELDHGDALAAPV